ncbi:MAG: hypothetical protein AB7F89_06385 [Pirellulaceae bacterium]
MTGYNKAVADSAMSEVSIDEMTAVCGGFLAEFYEPGYAIRDEKDVGVTFTTTGIFWKTAEGKVGYHMY